MKRNWDTIRELLTTVEQRCTRPVDSVRLSTFPDERADEISYHMELLMEAGLVKGKVIKSGGYPVNDFFADRLTWEGHEFLDAIRSDTVWAKTKKWFLDKGVDMTFDLVKIFAKDAGAALMKGTFGS